MNRIEKPLDGEFAPYAIQYINAVPDNGDPISQIAENGRELARLIRSLPEEKYSYRYAEGKWSLKEVLVHIIDTERNFNYRAMRFARNDKTPLPAFDQDAYVAESNAEERTMEDILGEYEAVKGATLALFRSFTDDMFYRNGTASGHNVTVRALAYMIAGHELHHIKIIKERYL